MAFRIRASLQETVGAFEFSKDQKGAFVIGALPHLTNTATEDDNDTNSYKYMVSYKA